MHAYVHICAHTHIYIYICIDARMYAYMLSYNEEQKKKPATFEEQFKSKRHKPRRR